MSCVSSVNEMKVSWKPRPSCRYKCRQLMGKIPVLTTLSAVMQMGLMVNLSKIQWCESVSQQI